MVNWSIFELDQFVRFCNHSCQMVKWSIFELDHFTISRPRASRWKYDAHSKNMYSREMDEHTLLKETV